MSFQRPMGRFDEPALFASAVARHRLFTEDATKALSRSAALMDPAALTAIANARQNAWILEWIGERYFNFGAPEREGRNTFTGIMSHLACLKEMLPTGKLTLVGEQEGAMGGVVPHLFRDEILADRFEWHVVAFDKDAKKPEIVHRTKGFNTSFRAFRPSNPTMSIPEALHAWTKTRLKLGAKLTSSKLATPFPGPNFASKAFPALWVRSPFQAGGETNRTVGFPILSPQYRQAYRRLGFNSAIADPDLEAAITRRVIAATLQLASTFMNAVGERLSFAQRAGGRGARSGGAYINGACYNPRILIALLNIFRIHYNFFELRQYVSPINKHDETTQVVDGTISLAVPGSDQRIGVPKRRRLAPVKRTPAMRAGIHLVEPDTKTPKLPNLAKVLYQPWLFHGTPLWAKLKTS